MRVYVPLTLSGLAEAYKTGELGTGSFVAYAVTPALREWYLSDDIEELEYAALNRAALASLRLLAADPDSPGAGSWSPSTYPTAPRTPTPTADSTRRRSARCGWPETWRWARRPPYMWISVTRRAM